MKRMKSSTLRAFTAAAVFVIVGIGLATHSGSGTLSSLGIDSIAAICPLGILESMLGSWSFVPRALIVFAIIAVLIIVFGKGFCSWICPVPHIENLFKSKKRKREDAKERGTAARNAYENWRTGTKPQRKRVTLDSRHAVLGGALLSTAIFGFPVFCLVCPIGLSFATFILLWRFVQFNDPTWGLIVFPLIIAIELFALRKWCGTFCPMGALLSLFSSLNRRFHPTVNTEACLRVKDGAGCEACAAACPEHIDPFADVGERPMSECVKCRNCADACPAHAISFTLKKRNLDMPGPDAAQAASTHVETAQQDEQGQHTASV